MSGNLIVAAVVFVVSVAVAIGLSLFVITVVLRMQAKHRRRLARVGRKRMSGRLDIDDMRMTLLRQKQEKNVLVTVTDALAKFIPLLDTTRLRANFRRAGLGWSVATFVMVSLVVGALLVGLVTWLAGLPFYLFLVPGLPLRHVPRRPLREVPRRPPLQPLHEAAPRRDRHHHPRHPLGPAGHRVHRLVGQEYGDPVGGHFQAISERVMLGEPLDAALWRVARVIDKPEMDFFAISIAIQVETGGSLSDALGNLADLLRKREQMKLKIKAISSEARASAMIIGALPFLMLGLLMMMSPDYVMPLFLDPRGQMMLGAGFTSICFGAFVMWRMTQFEI